LAEAAPASGGGESGGNFIPVVTAQERFQLTGTGPLWIGSRPGDQQECWLFHGSSGRVGILVRGGTYASGDTPGWEISRYCSKKFDRNGAEKL
jgi:hypothetical protein